MEEMNHLKLFTVDEANKLIPELQKFVTELRQKREAILAQEVEIDLMEIVNDKADAKNPTPAMNRKLEEYHRNVNRFYEIIDKIHEMGCFLKDVSMGLIDFYTLYKGKVVYLCWSLGETEITTWHEVGRGYSYRQPLEPDTETKQPPKNPPHS